MKLEQVMKRLVATLVIGTAMFALGDAWADGYKFVWPSQVNDLDGPGTLINWQCEHGVSLSPGFSCWSPVKDGPFEIYRDGVHIATVTNTDIYRDLDTVGGNVYSYVIKGHGQKSQEVAKLCYCSYHPIIGKPTVEVGNFGGSDSIQVSVLQKLWTNTWYYPEENRSSLGAEHLVESFVRCSASSDSDWLVLAGADESGNAIHDGEGEISFVVAPNMTDSERTAKISVRASSENWLVLTNIVVTQAAGPAGFAINFDACGGAGNASMRVRRKGETLGKLPEVNLDDCVFLGWFTEVEGGEAVAADTVVTGDATYYAHWIRLGESRQFVDAGGVVWKYQVLNSGSDSHPVLYARIVGDGNYPVSWGQIVETGAIDKSTSGALTIPSSLEGFPVRVIGPWAFAYCRNLTKVKFPDSVVTIEDCAFASCSGMESVQFGAHVATIGGGAFLYCTALKEVALPASVATLGASAFGGCESLTKLRVENNFSSGCHIVMGYRIGGMMFNLVSNGIDMDPLWDCTALSSIELGADVTSVYLAGFGKGPNLCSVICRGMLPTFSGGNTSNGRTTCYVLRENYPDGLPAETWAGMELKYLDGENPKQTVTFNANGGVVSPATRVVEKGGIVGTMPTPTRSGYSFVGWFTSASGGTKVTTATVVTGNVTYYAQWTKNDDSNPVTSTPVTPAPVSPDPVATDPVTPDPVATESVATDPVTPGYEVVDAMDIVAPYEAPKAVMLQGVVHDGGNVVGIVELKLGKVNAKKGTGRVSGSLTTLDGKKRAIKAVNLEGIDGVSPKDVSLEVKDLGTMSITIGGTQFAGSMGKYDVQSADVGGNWNKGGTKVYVDATSASLPAGALEELLPDGEPVVASGGKWKFAKAASVRWAKPKKGSALPEIYDAESGKGLVVDTSAGKTNLSGLKLAYTPKKGTFKGSFKVYALEEEGKSVKLKKYTVKVSGVVVDGVGYGTATCKNPALSCPVTVE